MSQRDRVLRALRAGPIIAAAGLATLTPAAGAVGGRMIFYHPAQPAIQAASAATPGMLTGAGDLGNTCDHTPNGGTVIRIVVSGPDPSKFVSCAVSAQAHGYRVMLAVKWDNDWSPAFDALWVRAALKDFTTAGVKPWAVAIGNEQELIQRAGVAGENAAQYAIAWRAIEPVVRLAAPLAVVVAGEASPWGTAYLAQALADGLPGAQALSEHLYPVYAADGLAPFVRLARSYGLAAWDTEGLCGPGFWRAGGCRSAAELRAAGVAVALEWFGGFGPQASQLPPAYRRAAA